MKLLIAFVLVNWPYFGIMALLVIAAALEKFWDVKPK